MPEDAFSLEPDHASRRQPMDRAGLERPALARGVRLMTDRKSGGPVLAFPEGVVELNATAHEVVRRCDGKTTCNAILSALAAEYEVSQAELQEDVFGCLNQLRERKLLVFVP